MKKKQIFLTILVILLTLSVFFINEESHSEYSKEKSNEYLKPIKEDPLRKVGTFKLMNVLSSEEKKIFFEANELYQKKMYKDSVEKLSLFITSYPKAKLTEDAYFLVGDCYYNLARETSNITDLEEAIEKYREAIKKYPVSSKIDWALYQIGNSYKKLGYGEEMRNSYQELIDRCPDSTDLPYAYFNIGKKLYDEVKYKDASDQFHYIVRHFPGSDVYAEAIYYEANCYYYVNDLFNAYNTYKQAINDYPKTLEYDPETQFNMAETFFQRNEIKIAQKLFLRFINLFPDHLEVDKALLRMGDCFKFLKEYREALFFYLENIVRDPNSDGALNAQIRMADINRIAPDIQLPYEVFEGYQLYAKPIRTYKDIASRYQTGELAEVALFKSAVFLYQEKRYKESIRTFEKIITNFPNTLSYEKSLSFYKDCLYQLVKKYYNEGDFFNVIDTYENGKDFFPIKTDGGEGFFFIGRSFQELQVYDSALSIYQELLTDVSAKSKAAINSSFEIARIYVQKNEQETAERRLKEFLKKYPRYEYKKDVFFLLGDTLYNQKKYKEVVKVYNRLLQLEKSNPKNIFVINCVLGNTYKELGQLENALSAYNRAREQLKEGVVLIDGEGEYSKNMEVSRADILFALNRYQKAMDSYNNIIQKYGDAEESSWAMYQVGRCYQKQGDILRADKSYKKLIEEKGDINFWSRQARFALEDIEWKQKYKQMMN
ncbi:MAG: tetratricopeptide repeat protein [bacterium]